MHIEPEWLPDETLYSLCSRLHRLTCHALSGDTTQMLFGTSRAGCQHDFPSRLIAFVARTQGRWGHVAEIIGGRTMLPYYLPFRSSDCAIDAYAAMAHVPGGMLKYRLGLLTSRFRAHHPLKACPQCMVEDEQNHHVAYWHLSHQYPSVWVCPTHQCPLLEATIKATGVRRFDWCLPDEGLFRTLVGMDGWQASTRSGLLHLARDSLALAALPRCFHFDLARLSTSYRIRAVQAGYCRPNGIPQWSRLAADYLAFVEPLRAVEALQALPASVNQARAELERLLRNPRSGTHPIRHLVIIAWLFPSWDDFLDAYNAPQAGPEAAAPVLNTAPSGHLDHRPGQLVEFLREQGLSFSRAARMLGITTATAMTWAAQAGMPVPRRAKILKPEVRGRVVAELQRGADKRAVAERFGVSLVTVTTTLRTTAGLHLAWSEAREQHTRQARRCEWDALVEEHTDAGIKALRGLAPACYAWLYRHDRVWFETRNAALRSKRTGNHAHVAWDARDAALAAQVQRVGAELAMGTGGKNVPLWELCQRIPELKAKLGHLDRLPMTERSLAIITRHRRKSPTSLL